ncbi:hypothetical protein SLEP1_g16711 [Rubroshorea leprosula]|uniref:Uncharacterized protein n=1 Tax=Rubroshorea leprosula TaxID=152421 RepID=A0AAV5J0X6_9ROSI|nr:hypothetical protein SLEP1_g16711 [Rubroshorea leprosula]
MKKLCKLWYDDLGTTMMIILGLAESGPSEFGGPLPSWMKKKSMWALTTPQSR